MVVLAAQSNSLCTCKCLSNKFLRGRKRLVCPIDDVRILPAGDFVNECILGILPTESLFCTRKKRRFK